MIKVIQIGFSSRGGGIESFAVSYNLYLKNEDIDVEYINVFEKAQKEEFYLSLSARNKIHNLPDYRKKPIAFVRAFRVLNEKEHYDILHYNMNSAAYMLPLYAAKRCGIKIIISHAHNSASDKGFLKKIVHNINRRLFPMLANTYFACSVQAAKWFYNSKIIEGNRFYLINNAVETKKFEFNGDKRAEIRKSLGIENGEIVIGNAARFKPQKNHKFLISIFEELIKIYPKSKLLLLGEGPLLKEIYEKVEANKIIKGKVIFLGQVTNANDYYNAMDAFVLPSIYEGLPYAGIEAQINGLSCVFSNSITKELGLTKNAIFLSIYQKPVEWAEMIMKSIQENKKRETHFIKEYDIENAAHKLADIYREIDEEVHSI